MKYIQKGTEPLELSNWKDSHKSSHFDRLNGDVKMAVKAALMKEQGFICCYCERRLTDADSHIEHFQPQSTPGVDSLSFANMLCSCQKDLRPGEPRHCGHLKGDWYDVNLLVSPLDRNCETRFAFLANGEIIVRIISDNGATETITRLGLGISKLIALRRDAIKPFLDSKLSDEDFIRFVNGYLQPDAESKFAEFFTTIRYLFAASPTAK